MRLDPNGAFRKCAKIVGEVMGNYHPHGDQAIYDALARLAQDFNVRYPLVDGQGNFGNIDGDNPAAQRYTEARLTAAAAALMEGLAEDAVDFRDNYDGSEREPVVLPAAFPNLLANGSSGIAVGMATNIPPHNIDELVQRLPAPDQGSRTRATRRCSTSCRGRTSRPAASSSSRGRRSRRPTAPGAASFRLRARWAVEDLGRGTWQVVVTEIPYQVQKGKLIERIAELVNAKKMPILADVRDESAEDVRIVLEPRARTVDPEVLMEMLFRASDLETRFAMNMNVLIDGRTPQVSTLKEVLRAFLDHRREVLLRRSRFRLGQDRRAARGAGGAARRLPEPRPGDRDHPHEDDPKAVMIAEFALSRRAGRGDPQHAAAQPAPARGDGDPRRARRADRRARRAGGARSASEEAQWGRIADELREVRKAFGKDAPGGARRTSFEDAPEVEEVAFEAMVEREPITVVCSEMGWIRAMKGPSRRRTPSSSSRTATGRASCCTPRPPTGCCSSPRTGGCTRSPAPALPGGRGMGEPVRLMLDLPNEAQLLALFVHVPGGRLLVASEAGDGFVLPEDEAVAQTRGGRQVLNLKEGVARRGLPAGRGRPRRGRRQQPQAAGLPARRAAGDGARQGRAAAALQGRTALVDALTFDLADGLSWKDPAGRTRTVTELADWIGARASAGRMAPRGFPASNRFD